MSRGLSFVIVFLSLLLAGCATTIKSDVTTFHQWPDNLRDKSFVFERTPEQANNLEYRSYENLVRSELLRLGFAEAASSPAAKLKVTVRYSMDSRDVRVVQPVTSYPGYGWPYYGSRWHRYGYSPFYDPFWYGPPYVEYVESSYQLFSRQLNVVIAQIADGKTLYDVTVNSAGRNESLAAVMPYLVRSAFLEFPGPNGVPRRVALKVEN